ncbi:HesA/MoeB/ThiF family protein [Plantibacter sp. YIM 135249]|uniref:HesA/MoeB/ThiF family protein n=1 Tax=Plantibacter sp. YIM 135249 TaxID=3423918 RepID=UPI003D335E8F
MTTPFVVLTRGGERLIRESPDAHGRLHMHFSAAVGSYVIDRVGTHADVMIAVNIPAQFQALRWDGEAFAGQWFKAAGPEVAIQHLALRHRPTGMIPFTAFRELVHGVDDPGALLGLLVVHTPNLPERLARLGAREFSAWAVSRDGVHPVDFESEPDVYGAGQLATHWPVDRFAGNTVAVVGVGSIGSHVAASLAQLGVGKMHLIDPDRLLWHNVVRHHLGSESVGRFKVDAMRDNITEKNAGTDVIPRVEAHHFDVVEHAELLHEIIRDADIVVCCADGIAPRRVVNHFSRILGKPAVLACVLGDGSVGEVLRLRPGGRFGCLLCQRAALSEMGAIDAEADQELAYGTGHTHKPMTAIPNDLRLVADLAAKVTVATLLESLHGERSQRLPGEWALVGLQAGRELAAPFDFARAGEVRWSEVPPSREGCATCSLT